MAKIGNEARLILKLAKERMDKKVANRPTDVRFMARTTAYKGAVAEYNLELDAVVRELEAGR